jgi:hypothetical protein
VAVAWIINSAGTHQTAIDTCLEVTWTPTDLLRCGPVVLQGAGWWYAAFLPDAVGMGVYAVGMGRYARANLI